MALHFKRFKTWDRLQKFFLISPWVELLVSCPYDLRPLASYSAEERASVVALKSQLATAEREAHAMPSGATRQTCEALRAQLEALRSEEAQVSSGSTQYAEEVSVLEKELQKTVSWPPSSP